jgi:hypothetical protein
MGGGGAMRMLLFLRTTGYCPTTAPFFQLRSSWFFSSPDRRFASFLSRACCLFAVGFVSFGGLRRRFRSCASPEWFLLPPGAGLFFFTGVFLLVGLSVVVFDRFHLGLVDLVLVEA